MRLFLVARHGQSLFNVDKLVNGDPELDRGLSEQGIEEAQHLGGEIAALPLDLVAVSPFPRALQTANIALDGREVPHLVDDDLGDVRIGELEGESLDAYRVAPAHTNRKERFPGGESLDDAAGRYASAFAKLLERDEPVTLVVCHEIPIRYALNAAAGSAELDAPEHGIPNATPYLFDDDTLARAVKGIERIVANSSER